MSLLASFDLSANGSRLRFTRNIADITMDVNGVERVDLKARGGTDTITLGNLLGTDVSALNADLAGVPGSGIGDGAADLLVVNGTAGADVGEVAGGSASATVFGLPTAVNIAGAEGANDALVVSALGGDDVVNAATLPAGIFKVTLEGGSGSDVLLGSLGADRLLGGDGTDVVMGGRGDDLALLGPGDDAFQWNPGDGSDTIEGEDGFDTMHFSGANISEKIGIAANAGRVRFSRDVANIAMDLNDVERIDFRALGGADQIVVGDLSGTDVTRNDLDLRSSVGGGDGQADTVIVDGTQGADVYSASGAAGAVAVVGLPAGVNILGAEQPNDRLVLRALDGNDVVDASSLQADGIQLGIQGEAGADVLIGSHGNDDIRGGDGDDLALLGAGDDTFTTRPRHDNDTVEGQAGTDAILFNGNHSESVDIAAVGGRVRLAHDAAIAMDLNDVERIDFRAFSGADTIAIGDLTGTDMTRVNADLGGDSGHVIVNGTAGDDSISVVGGASAVTVEGLAATVGISNPDLATDRLDVNTLAGSDAVGVTAGAQSLIQLFADGSQIF